MGCHLLYEKSLDEGNYLFCEESTGKGVCRSEVLVRGPKDTDTLPPSPSQTKDHLCWVVYQ